MHPNLLNKWNEVIPGPFLIYLIPRKTNSCYRMNQKSCIIFPGNHIKVKNFVNLPVPQHQQALPYSN